MVMHVVVSRQEGGFYAPQNGVILKYGIVIRPVFAACLLPRHDAAYCLTEGSFLSCLCFLSRTHMHRHRRYLNAGSKTDNPPEGLAFLGAFAHLLGRGRTEASRKQSQ